MNEQQILKKIEAWDDQDKIQPIIDFIENLSPDEQSVEVMGELARAYNNLYWKNPTEENKKYLEKAIAVLLYLEKEQGDTAYWNYRMAYSHFYLNNLDQAQYFFQKDKDLGGNGNDTEIYLKCIEIAKEKGLTGVEVYSGGKGNIEYPLERFLNHLKTHAPRLVETLLPAVSDTEIASFEQKIGKKLPEDFVQLHKTFSGQKEGSAMFNPQFQRWVAFSEIEEVQQKWIKNLEETFGKNWQTISLNEAYSDVDEVKNTLYSKNWIPFLVGQDYLICIDLEPVNEENYGQVICISYSDYAEQYAVEVLYFELAHWLGDIERGLYMGLITYDEDLNMLRFNATENAPAYYTDDEMTELVYSVEREFGAISEIMEDNDDAVLKCDVFVVPPNEDKDYYTLITSGLGAYKMEMPGDIPYAENIELAINLPASWNPNSHDEKDVWAVQWLKNIAALPVTYHTYLSGGHSIPIGGKIPGTDFVGFVLAHCLKFVKEDETQPVIAQLSEDKKIHFYYLTPVFQEELDYKLEYSADALFDKFIEHDVPYPPVVEVLRPNVCEGYIPDENIHLLDEIQWAFNENIYESLMNFWDAVVGYNEKMGNDLEEYNPFATLFRSPKVKLLYEAWIESEEQLWEYEKLVDTSIFKNSPNEDGLYKAEILALCESLEPTFNAITMLLWIHNSLSNKELYENIFFEGFAIEGYEEDGTPVISLKVGT